jgi:hypothetical protein
LISLKEMAFTKAGTAEAACAATVNHARHVGVGIERLDDEANPQHDSMWLAIEKGCPAGNYIWLFHSLLP